MQIVGKLVSNCLIKLSAILYCSLYSYHLSNIVASIVFFLAFKNDRKIEENLVAIPFKSNNYRHRNSLKRDIYRESRQEYTKNQVKKIKITFFKQQKKKQFICKINFAYLCTNIIFVNFILVCKSLSFTRESILQRSTLFIKNISFSTSQ